MHLFFHEGIVSYIFLGFCQLLTTYSSFCFTSLHFQQKKMSPVGTSWRNLHQPVFADIVGMPEQKPASPGTWSFCAGELLSPSDGRLQGGWMGPGTLARCVWKLPGRFWGTVFNDMLKLRVVVDYLAPENYERAILKLKEHSTKWHPGRVRVWLCACVFPAWNT